MLLFPVLKIPMRDGGQRLRDCARGERTTQGGDHQDGTIHLRLRTAGDDMFERAKQRLDDIAADQ